MRAAWIATVANIDWPSNPNLSTTKQKEELLTMLDGLAKNNINTVIFQARPTADALYLSTLEPWSRYLTGRQGTKPEPYWDPLAFLVEEAHRRCMEVHVWLNPYRVLNDNGIGGLSADHIYHRRKDLIVQYGGKYYFNPGLDDTRKHLNDVVRDVVERYDIDAIHFDDYFYPYPVGGNDFPDQETYVRYPRGFKNKADWRRNNVDMVISELRETIKSVKPWVEFGISPFGVWRNQHVDPTGSATRAGIQNYDDLYADILKWLREGTIDYVTPQLYWEIGKKVADYEILLDWWVKNSYDRKLYIGLFASGLEINKDQAWKRPNELARQLRMNKRYPELGGVMYYSARPFLRNPQGLNDSLQTRFYQHKSITPEHVGADQVTALQPGNIRILKDGDDAVLMWDPLQAAGGQAAVHYIVYGFKGRRVGDLNDASNILQLTTDHVLNLKDFDFRGYYTFVVTAVNRYRKESTPSYGVTRRL